MCSSDLTFYPFIYIDIYIIVYNDEVVMKGLPYSLDFDKNVCNSGRAATNAGEIGRASCRERV